MLYEVPRHGDIWQQGAITPRILYVSTVLDGDELTASRSGRHWKVSKRPTGCIGSRMDPK